MMLTEFNMLPQNCLSGREKNEDLDAIASLYARASLPAGLLSPSHASQVAFLDSILQQQRRQQEAALLAALGSASAASLPTDSLNALLARRNLEQAALLGLPATPAVGLGSLSGLTAAERSLLLGQSASSATAPTQQLSPSLPPRTTQKGRTGTFPQKLHLMLTDLVKQEGGKEIAAFLPHGRAFCIYKPKEFANKIMPMYFRMSHFSSFQRQLNLYEFQRIREGRDKGGYYHSLFLEKQPALCSSIHRTKIKSAAATAAGLSTTGPTAQQQPDMGILGPTFAYLTGGEGIP